MLGTFLSTLQWWVMGSSWQFHEMSYYHAYEETEAWRDSDLPKFTSQKVEELRLLSFLFINSRWWLSKDFELGWSFRANMPSCFTYEGSEVHSLHLTTVVHQSHIAVQVHLWQLGICLSPLIVHTFGFHIFLGKRQVPWCHSSDSPLLLHCFTERDWHECRW